LTQNLELFCGLAIVPFDNLAATKFQEIKRQRLRLGTMDQKIAAIVLAHDAVLLTRNVTDFKKVPGLRIENWID
jgi:tRNA(fMet)-specific endonuclease VapC